MYLDKSFGTQAASNSKLFKKLKWEFIIFQKFEFDKKIAAKQQHYLAHFGCDPLVNGVTP